MDRHQDTLRSVGLLVLRAGFAGYMITHGIGKLRMVLDGRLDSFGDPIGIGSAASLLLVTFAEFFCAILVLVGAATRLAVIPIIIAMGVAAFVAHAGDPWTAGRGAELFFSGASKSWASKQVPLMFLVAFLALGLTGAGRFSIDHLIASRRV